MTTKADELKAQMAQLDANIEAQKVLRDARFERVKLIDDFIAQLEKRRLTLQAQLEREDTLLVKLEGPCVELEAADGVIWNL